MVEFQDMARKDTFTAVCALLLWIGACPKRQTSKSLVVYVPAPPPPAAAAAPTSSDQKPAVLVIEEPAPPPPPQPTEAAPAQTTEEPSAQHRVRRPVRTEAQTEPDDSTSPEAPVAPPAQVPALEPRESSAQEVEMRRQFSRLDQDIRQRIARLNPAQLSTNDRKTLDDARAFFAQATQAMTSGDLPRAVNLAKKASLLLAALE